VPGRSAPQLADAGSTAKAASAEHARAAQPAPPEPPQPLTLAVTLNRRDAQIVLALAEDEYRTPAQQVGWIVAQWTKLHASTHRAPSSPVASTPAPASSNGTAPPSAPLVPVYHVGDGSAGSGCGKVGLFFRRPIGTGDTIQPGDAVQLDGAPLTSGPLVCGQCGAPFTMAPRNWRAGHEEEA